MTRRTDSVSAEARIRVMKRDRFQCTYCGVPGTDAELEIDHIVAVAKGGSNHISNLTTACRACNQRKSDGPAPARIAATPGAASRALGLVGMYVLSFEKGSMQYQGVIVGMEGDDCLVQLFSWMTGDATEVKPWPKSFVYSDAVKIFANRDTFTDEVERQDRIEIARSRAPVAAAPGSGRAQH